VASDEDGNGGGELCADERCDVRNHEGCWACQAPVGLIGGAASPAALIEAVGCDAAAGEIWKETVIAVNVVIETVDPDQFCFWGIIGLEWRLLVRVLGEGKEGKLRKAEWRLTSHVLVYKDTSPIL